MAQSGIRTPRAPAPGAGGGIEGVAASGQRTRRTAVEAEAALRTRVAAEAEAGEIRAHALSGSSREGKGSVKAPAYREGRRVRGR